jgi:hypothetical protein
MIGNLYQQVVIILAKNCAKYKGSIGELMLTVRQFLGA